MNKDNAKDYLPLVHALAEGKVIQGHMAYSGRWEDIPGDIHFNGPASDYRIKPEPREIWVNRHEDVGLAYNFYASKEAAADGIRPGWEPVCFREVIE
ncbi:hypothetical protein B9Y78_07985 [Stenotrophomonas maltophilia]|uniref:hypothetical protein n=1 Tax=Stenotrophomonas maltophilia TaxID=40324 RepID=UPI000C261D78|nr:hypothetical protein [Stenotrophomonas maltophilia]PJL41036.1 hypothetical protein B9Y78_07985 [Stenotrophomonas maltophilia]